MLVKPHIASLKPSDTLRINQLSKELIEQGRTIYRFGFGQSPFPVPNIMQERLKQHTQEKDYLPVQGLLSLREEIAKHKNLQIEEVDFDASDIFIGPGSKELIFLALLAIDAPLILPNPSWVSYEPQAKIQNKELYWVETEISNWKLTARQLDDFVEQNSLQGAIIILNYPSNPTGQHLSEQELVSLSHVCRRHKLTVISDEIYTLLAFDGEYHTIAKYYPEGTIITSGISKWAGAGGWRMGYAAIPRNFHSLVTAMSSLASETFSAVSAPIQFAAVQAYLDNFELAQYRRRANEILYKVAEYCYVKLRDQGVRLCPALGGFYLFPNLDSWIPALNKRGIFTSEQMCSELLAKTGVALLPGSVFGRPEDEMSFRLSFVDFDGEQAMSSLMAHGEITDENFNDLFPNIVGGINGLLSYLNGLNA